MAKTCQLSFDVSKRSAGISHFVMDGTHTEESGGLHLPVFDGPVVCSGGGSLRVSLSNSCASRSRMPSVESFRRHRNSGAQSASYNTSNTEQRNMPLPISASSISLGGSRKLQKPFVKLSECAHFHYDTAVLGPLRIVFENLEDFQSFPHPVDNLVHAIYCIKVSSNDVSWIIHRTYEQFREFDLQLHRCVYDRRFSNLPEFDEEQCLKNVPKKEIFEALKFYMQRFSEIAGSLITCGPVLKWLEMDNHGNRLLDVDDTFMNTPAVACAQVVKPYSAQAADELSLQVGEIISITDIALSTDWMRGKKELRRDRGTRRPSASASASEETVERVDRMKAFAGFQVGFFPAGCVELIGGAKKVPPIFRLSTESLKPVLQRRGKFVAMFRTFLASRPAILRLKESGILKERVFGCDLAEYLQNTGQDVPLVLKSCSHLIETYGIVNGIYRLSGIQSNIQRLRNAFDENREPTLLQETILQDVHCVASVLKMFFRDLPNPLFTYALYSKFVEAVQGSDSSAKIVRLHQLVQQLPPPYYRTAEYLMRHLSHVADHGHKTGMNQQNLSIVWAPNLFRCKELEHTRSCASGMIQSVTVQAVITEYLIRYVEIIFNHKFPAFGCSGSGLSASSRRRNRPRSLAVSTPSKLLNLEEAQQKLLAARHQKVPPNVGLPDLGRFKNCIDVNGGPSALPVYHTVIELPRRSSRKGGPLRVLFRSRRSTAEHKESKENFPPKATKSWSSRRHTSVSVPGSHATPLNPAHLVISRPIISTAMENVVALRHQQQPLRTVRSAESLLSIVTGSQKGSGGDGSRVNSQLLSDDHSLAAQENTDATVIAQSEQLTPLSAVSEHDELPVIATTVSTGIEEGVKSITDSNALYLPDSNLTFSAMEIPLPILPKLEHRPSGVSPPPAKLPLLETDMDAEFRRDELSYAMQPQSFSRSLFNEWEPASPLFLAHSMFSEQRSATSAETDDVSRTLNDTSLSPISEPSGFKIFYDFERSVCSDDDPVPGNSYISDSDYRCSATSYSRPKKVARVGPYMSSEASDTGNTAPSYRSTVRVPRRCCLSVPNVSGSPDDSTEFLEFSLKPVISSPKVDWDYRQFSESTLNQPQAADTLRQHVLENDSDLSRANDAGEEEASVEFCSVSPNWFLQNSGQSSYHSAQTSGMLPSPTYPSGIPEVQTTEDVIHVSPPGEGKLLISTDLPQSLSHNFAELQNDHSSAEASNNQVVARDVSTTQEAVTASMLPESALDPVEANTLVLCNADVVSKSLDVLTKVEETNTLAPPTALAFQFMSLDRDRLKSTAEYLHNKDTLEHTAHHPGHFIENVTSVCQLGNEAQAYLDKLNETTNFPSRGGHCRQNSLQDFSTANNAWDDLHLEEFLLRPKKLEDEEEIVPRHIRLMKQKSIYDNTTRSCLAKTVSLDESELERPKPPNNSKTSQKIHSYNYTEPRRRSDKQQRPSVKLITADAGLSPFAKRCSRLDELHSLLLKASGESDLLQDRTTYEQKFSTNYAKVEVNHHDTVECSVASVSINEVDPLQSAVSANRLPGAEIRQKQNILDEALKALRSATGDCGNETDSRATLCAAATRSTGPRIANAIAAFEGPAEKVTTVRPSFLRRKQSTDSSAASSGPESCAASPAFETEVSVVQDRVSQSSVDYNSKPANSNTSSSVRPEGLNWSSEVGSFITVPAQSVGNNLLLESALFRKQREALSKACFEDQSVRSPENESMKRTTIALSDYEYFNPSSAQAKPVPAPRSRKTRSCSEPPNEQSAPTEDVYSTLPSISTGVAVVASHTDVVQPPEEIEPSRVDSCAKSTRTVHNSDTKREAFPHISQSMPAAPFSDTGDDGKIFLYRL